MLSQKYIIIITIRESNVVESYFVSDELFCAIRVPKLQKNQAFCDFRILDNESENFEIDCLRKWTDFVKKWRIATQKKF